LKSGKLRALAVTSTQASALAPGLPTVAASGLPGYESAALTVIFAPAKTPINIISTLNQAVVQSLKKEDVKERFIAAGVEPVGSTPQEMGNTIKSEMSRLGKVIRDAGIHAN